MLRRIAARCHSRAASALHAGSPDEFSLRAWVVSSSYRGKNPSTAETQGFTLAHNFETIAASCLESLRGFLAGNGAKGEMRRGWHEERVGKQRHQQTRAIRTERLYGVDKKPREGLSVRGA